MTYMSNAKPNNKPIGVFDSGIGGLTVVDAIQQHLPGESIIYFGDTAHLPYGDKSADAIRYYSLKITKYLIDQGCKMVVIACNSASSAAYHVLTDFFKSETLFVNVVDPLVKYTSQKQYSKVGVIATKATIESRVYEQRLKEQNIGLKVFSMATPLLVPMIEEGFYDDKLSLAIIDNYLSHPQFKDIDAILLACTHYPLIRQQIFEYFQQKVDVIDSTASTVEVIEQELNTHDLLADISHQPDYKFAVSDISPTFEATTNIFLKKPVSLVHEAIW